MSGSVNYLVISGRDNLAEILLQAQQVGIMSDRHSYVITNPDFHIIDIELFKHGGSNITGNIVLALSDIEKVIYRIVTFLDKHLNLIKIKTIEDIKVILCHLN